eukprot:82022_1
MASPARGNNSNSNARRARRSPASANSHSNMRPNHSVSLRSQRQARRNIDQRGDPNDDGSSTHSYDDRARRHRNDPNSPQSDLRNYQRNYPPIHDSRSSSNRRGMNRDPRARGMNSSGSGRRGMNASQSHIPPANNNPDDYQPSHDESFQCMANDPLLWGRFHKWQGGTPHEEYLFTKETVDSARQRMEHHDNGCNNSQVVCHCCTHPRMVSGDTIANHSVNTQDTRRPNTLTCYS